MNLLLRISPDQILATYRQVKILLQGYDAVIFQAMEEVTRSRAHPFVGPVGPSEYTAKHEEIEKLLEPAGILGGRELTLRLLERVSQSVASSPPPTVDPGEFLNAVRFHTDQEGVFVRLGARNRWTAEWRVHLKSPYQTSNPVRLDVHEHRWGEIVPSYVVQYISMAVDAYNRGMTAAAAALLSIATEATLRDVLAPRGYSFRHGAPANDVYDWGTADLGVAGGAYTLTFPQAMPKGTGDLPASLAGAASASVKIRRQLVSDRKLGTRIDLTVRLPPQLVDHLSPATISQPAQKKVSGLGEALRIARTVERVLLPKHLPEDLDQVLLKVRNNLIHMSGDALKEKIDAIPDPATGKPPITLGRFLETPALVYDLFLSVPNFINQQYVDLRQAGHLAS